MGLKESGLRGSLRNVSVGIDAIPDAVIEQFDAGNLDGYEGDTSFFSITQSNTLVGDNALINDDQSSNNQIIINPNLDNTPERGDEWAFFAEWGIMDMGAMFAYSSDSANYIVGAIDDDGSGDEVLRIYKDSKGAGDDVIASDTISDPADDVEWVEFFVEFGSQNVANEEIRATVFEITNEDGDPSGIPPFNRGSQLAQTTATDNEYDSGDFGWQVTQINGDWIVDYALNYTKSE